MTKIGNLWLRLLLWVEDMAQRNQKTLSEILREQDEVDRKEVRDAEKVITTHQYLKHMAEANLQAREVWRRLQREAAQDRETVPKSTPSTAPSLIASERVYKFDLVPEALHESTKPVRDTAHET